MTTVSLDAADLVPARGGMEPFSWQARQGTLVCLVGPDPAMRSAYLRAFAGAEYPRNGTLAILGRPLDELDDRAWLALRRDVGFVTRDAPLVSSMDALRNVMLPALYHGLGKRAEVERRAEEWLTRLGFQGGRQLLPAYLGEAECKVVALARALMLGPKLLLVDAILHGGHSRELRAVLHDVAQWCRAQGTTLIHATDDMAFVREFADEIIFVAPPRPQLFGSWAAFHDAGDTDVQEYFSRFRSEAMAFE